MSPCICVCVSPYLPLCVFLFPVFVSFPHFPTVRFSHLISSKTHRSLLPYIMGNICQSDKSAAVKGSATEDLTVVFVLGECRVMSTRFYVLALASTMTNISACLFLSPFLLTVDRQVEIERAETEERGKKNRRVFALDVRKVGAKTFF